MAEGSDTLHEEILEPFLACSFASPISHIWLSNATGSFETPRYDSSGMALISLSELFILTVEGISAKLPASLLLRYVYVNYLRARRRFIETRQKQMMICEMRRIAKTAYITRVSSTRAYHSQ